MSPDLTPAGLAAAIRKQIEQFPSYPVRLDREQEEALANLAETVARAEGDALVKDVEAQQIRIIVPAKLGFESEQLAPKIAAALAAARLEVEASWKEAYDNMAYNYHETAEALAAERERT